MHADAILQFLFVQYDFWCRGTLQQKLNLIFNHKQIVISFIQGDKPTKPRDKSSKLGDEMAGDEMAWGRNDCKASLLFSKQFVLGPFALWPSLKWQLHTLECMLGSRSSLLLKKNKIIVIKWKKQLYTIFTKGMESGFDDPSKDPTASSPHKHPT